ncbi:D-alanyl-D-alanine carboxypeptidase family protein [Clostridium rectalis]|uniref:D-alanyl-D-alanine carboxypeptidase family protein n=1 Tax=Clostridium rectalis TaxID=2040295 RepID=UPI0019CF791F|nr:D-alanyl-D-alanine carboxypeptidase family protein [Clostridium rectalis]
MKKKSISLILSLFMSFSLCSTVLASNSKQPSIYGKSAVTMDMETGELIYTKAIDQKSYPASTTKLLTALILAENKGKDDDLKYTKDAKNQPEYSLNKNLHPIQIGETMTGEDVMDGLLLYSGNDIAYVIADNIAGNATNFAKIMNDKLSKLGLKNSNFVTPNGLHNPNHYTTAYDLTVIGRAAFQNPWVKESMEKQTSTIKTSNGTTMIIENRNQLLGKDGCIGGKTGYTASAGRCLVAMFERNGRKMIGVVMNSVYDRDDSFVFNDMKKIIDWSYDAEKKLLYKKDSVIKTERLSYKPLVFFGPEKTIEVPLVVKEDVTYYDNDVNKSNTKKDFKLDKLNIWKLNNDKSIGTLTLKEKEAKKEFKIYTTVSKGTILKSNLLLYIGSLVILIVIISAIIIIIKAIISRKNRNKRSKYI